MIFSITLSFELMLFKLKFKLRIRQEKLLPHTEQARFLKSKEKTKNISPGKANICLYQARKFDNPLRRWEI